MPPIKSGRHESLSKGYDDGRFRQVSEGTTHFDEKCEEDARGLCRCGAPQTLWPARIKLRGRRPPNARRLRLLASVGSHIRRSERSHSGGEHLRVATGLSSFVMARVASQESAWQRGPVRALGLFSLVGDFAGCP